MARTDDSQLAIQTALHRGPRRDSVWRHRPGHIPKLSIHNSQGVPGKQRLLRSVDIAEMSRRMPWCFNHLEFISEQAFGPGIRSGRHRCWHTIAQESFEQHQWTDLWHSVSKRS